MPDLYTDAEHFSGFVHCLACFEKRVFFLPICDLHFEVCIVPPLEVGGEDLLCSEVNSNPLEDGRRLGSQEVVAVPRVHPNCVETTNAEMPELKQSGVLVQCPNFRETIITEVFANVNFGVF